MKKFALPEDINPSGISARSALDEVLRNGARKMLQEAIEQEVLEYIESRQCLKNENNRRLVTRNGRLPARDILTGIGAIPIHQPRIRDRRNGHAFSSAIVPKYKRKTKNLNQLVPELYLRGISTNQFPDALAAILGENAEGLSATNITRMKAIWEEEYNVRRWRPRLLGCNRGGISAMPPTALLGT